MSKIKYLVLSAIFSLSVTASAMAQFQPTPSNPTRNSTYKASAIVTTAASATDIFTIKGSASRVVTVTSIECSGLATTAGAAPLSLIKRSTANSGGTSSAPTAVPVQSSLPAATAVVAAYTANPTVGTAVGTVGSKIIGLPLAATGVGSGVSWDFVSSGFSQPIVLRGAAQSLSVNGGGATLAAGATLGCTITWTES